MFLVKEAASHLEQQIYLWFVFWKLKCFQNVVFMIERHFINRGWFSPRVICFKTCLVWVEKDVTPSFILNWNWAESQCAGGCVCSLNGRNNISKCIRQILYKCINVKRPAFIKLNMKPWREQKNKEKNTCYHFNSTKTWIQTPPQCFIICFTLNQALLSKTKVLNEAQADKCVQKSHIELCCSHLLQMNITICILEVKVF